MARPKNQQAAEAKIPEGIPAGHAITLAEEKLVHTAEAYTDERDLINQLMGQIQMTSAISKLTTVVGLTKLAHIKETKLYRALAGKKGVDRDGNEIADVGTFEGFCLAIGSTRQKVDEDLLNLRTFGEEAMNSLTSVGAGYRELRQLRKLPEDQQTALIEVARLGDKDSFIELAEEIITKHAKEKESIAKENADIKADYEAQEKIILDKNKKIDAQEKLLHKLQNRSGDWHPRAFEICMENTRIGAGALEALDRLDVMRDAILNEDFGEDGREAAIEAMAVVHYDTLNQIVDRVAEVMAACEEVFIGYKEKARPMLQVFGEQQG
jgi:hypothetical protein